MSADSLAAIMATSGTAIAAAYQPPPSSACSVGNTLNEPPHNSIVTSANLGRPLLWLDEDFPVSYNTPPPPLPPKRQRAPRAIRKTAYTAAAASAASAADAKKQRPAVPDLMAIEKFLDSPLAVSRYNPVSFLEDFVFDNAPCHDLPHPKERVERVDRVDRHWPPRSVDTSPSSSVSAISPIGCSSFWPPPSADLSSPVWSPPAVQDRASPTSLVDVFEKMRPFSFC
ncbi:uncharacterized protein LOC117650455 [Thrips palmi]|uniref:Uncharacterized protein LOC117650455 n=1 Tax=Thrips palmi TaxID=161013 RepID=A0A6P8ZY92_THRPL|nr:uncharacterized protein LOC117650455 [Thrips palmi]